MFGLLPIIETSSLKEAAISMGFSSIYTINEQDFISILKENKIDYVTEKIITVVVIFI